MEHSACLPTVIGGGISLSGQNAPMVACVLATYFVINIFYCFKGKEIAIVDVFCIATGFVLRVLGGSAATGIVVSHWLVMMTFLLALFLAIAKRRDDVLRYERDGTQMRKVIARYNSTFLNQALGIVAAITIVSYTMYTVSEEVVVRVGSPYLYMTSVFVLAGILRYLQITLVDARSGSPTKILLKDRFIQACIFFWLAMFVIILYF